MTGARLISASAPTRKHHDNQANQQPVQKDPCMINRIMRLPEVLTATGVSPATIWRWVKAGNFPAPVKLGPNATGWRATDVESWIESRKQHVA